MTRMPTKTSHLRHNPLHERRLKDVNQQLGELRREVAELEKKLDNDHGGQPIQPLTARLTQVRKQIQDLESEKEGHELALSVMKNQKSRGIVERFFESGAALARRTLNRTKNKAQLAPSLEPLQRVLALTFGGFKSPDEAAQAGGFANTTGWFNDFTHGRFIDDAVTFAANRAAQRYGLNLKVWGGVPPVDDELNWRAWQRIVRSDPDAAALQQIVQANE